MSPELIAVLAVIAVAMAFDYTNGFHDAANAIATSISTRALTPGSPWRWPPSATSSARTSAPGWPRRSATAW